ncbi:hypothetical protein [Flindersiella endophytica]
MALVARNLIAHASVTYFAEIAHRDDIVLVPIHDLPAIDLVLLWSTAHENQIIRTFARFVGEVSDSHSSAAPG